MTPLSALRIVATLLSSVSAVALTSCREREASSPIEKALAKTDRVFPRNQTISAAPAPPNPVVFTSMSRTSGDSRFQSSKDRSFVGASGAAVAPSMLVRTGHVVIQVDSLERSIEAVRKIAAAFGGYVGNVSMNTGENEVHSATLEVKIPTARFDDAVLGVKPLGKVESSSASATDVGEEFVDVSARIANSKRLEARLVALLSTRTGKLEDVLAVERELARVREEIERSETRVRYLSTRIAMSTINVTVHEKAPLVASQPGTSVMGRALTNMLRNFVGFVATGIELLGFVVPMFVLAFLGWIVWTRTRRGPATQS